MWIIVLVCALLVLAVAIGVVGTLGTVWSLRHARAIEAWPTVRARIDHCDSEVQRHGSSDVLDVQVEYTYSVGGKAYVGSGIHPLYSAGRKECERLCEALDAAKVVLARYNPANPTEAYLITGNFTHYRAALFVSLLFVAFGVLFATGFALQFFGNTDYASALVVLE